MDIVCDSKKKRALNVRKFQMLKLKKKEKSKKNGINTNSCLLLACVRSLRGCVHEDKKTQQREIWKYWHDRNIVDAFECMKCFPFIIYDRLVLRMKHQYCFTVGFI